MLAALLLSGCVVLPEDARIRITTHAAYTREYVAATLPLVQDPYVRALGQQLARDSRDLDEIVK